MEGTVKIVWRPEVSQYDIGDFNPVKFKQRVTFEDIDTVIATLKSTPLCSYNSTKEIMTIKVQWFGWSVLCIALYILFMIATKWKHWWTMAVIAPMLIIVIPILIRISIYCRQEAHKKKVVLKEMELRKLATRLNSGYLYDRDLFLRVGAKAVTLELDVQKARSEAERKKEAEKRANLPQTGMNGMMGGVPDLEEGRGFHGNRANHWVQAPPVEFLNVKQAY